MSVVDVAPMYIPRFVCSDFFKQWQFGWLSISLFIRDCLTNTGLVKCFYDGRVWDFVSLGHFQDSGVIDVEGSTTFQRFIDHVPDAIVANDGGDYLKLPTERITGLNTLIPARLVKHVNPSMTSSKMIKVNYV